MALSPISPNFSASTAYSIDDRSSLSAPRLADTAQPRSQASLRQQVCNRAFAEGSGRHTTIASSSKSAKTGDQQSEFLKLQGQLWVRNCYDEMAERRKQRAGSKNLERALLAVPALDTDELGLTALLRSHQIDRADISDPVPLLIHCNQARYDLTSDQAVRELERHLSASAASFHIIHIPVSEYVNVARNYVFKRHQGQWQQLHANRQIVRGVSGVNSFTRLLNNYRADKNKPEIGVYSGLTEEQYFAVQVFKHLGQDVRHLTVDDAVALPYLLDFSSLKTPPATLDEAAFGALIDKEWDEAIPYNAILRLEKGERTITACWAKGPASGYLSIEQQRYVAQRPSEFIRQASQTLMADAGGDNTARITLQKFELPHHMLTRLVAGLDGQSVDAVALPVHVRLLAGEVTPDMFHNLDWILDMLATNYPDVRAARHAVTDATVSELGRLIEKSGGYTVVMARQNSQTSIFALRPLAEPDQTGKRWQAEHMMRGDVLAINTPGGFLKTVSRKQEWSHMVVITSANLKGKAPAGIALPDSFKVVFDSLRKTLWGKQKVSDQVICRDLYATYGCIPDTLSTAMLVQLVNRFNGNGTHGTPVSMQANQFESSPIWLENEGDNVLFQFRKNQQLHTVCVEHIDGVNGFKNPVADHMAHGGNANDERIPVIRLGDIALESGWFDEGPVTQIWLNDASDDGLKKEPIRLEAMLAEPGKPEDSDEEVVFMGRAPSLENEHRELALTMPFAPDTGLDPHADEEEEVEVPLQRMSSQALPERTRSQESRELARSRRTARPHDDERGRSGRRRDEHAHDIGSSRNKTRKSGGRRRD